MEYAVPREAGLAALREVRALDRERATGRISFPVEVRDRSGRRRTPLPGLRARHRSTWPSTRTRRPTTRGYFHGVEDVLRGYDGRPHWGKLHSRTAAGPRAGLPPLADFQAMRDRLDPDRVFTNAYLERVLGP